MLSSTSPGSAVPRIKLTRQEKLIAMMREDGVEIPESLTMRPTIRHEADSLIEYIETPHHFREKKCKQCSRHFATNYGAVAMCSDKCRIEWLRNIGIEWNPSKSQKERWAPAEIPLTVPPEALALSTLL